MKKFMIMFITGAILLSSLAISAPVMAQEGNGTCPTGCEGLTPGYWKNHLSAWECYTTSTTLEDVFDVPDSLGLDDKTLLQALNFGGGPGLTGMAKIMFRQAVAALLNSCSSMIGYPYLPEEVIGYVNAVNWNSRSHMELLKDTFEASNELGTCNGD